MGHNFSAPPPLTAGSVVRLIRPAGAYDASRLNAGVRWLEAQGLRPRLGRAMERGQYYAGPLQDRIDDLKEALACPEAQALWAVRGGSGTAQLLPDVAEHLEAHLDRTPVWLVGFSDITALHSVWGRHGVMSLHGAHVTSVVEWSPQAQAELLGLLGLGSGAPEGAARHPCVPCVWPEGAGNGPVSGPLVGGNLTVLASLCGTGVLPSWRGCVLFLEEIDERPYRLDRCLNQLIASGALFGVRAVVFGQLTRCDASAAADGGYTALQLLLPTLRRLDVPVVTGISVGHEASSRPLLLGATAELVAGGTVLQVTP